jgi:hypothetical protein
MLVQILRDSLQVYGSEYYFTTSTDSRCKLLENIINQQSEKLIDIKDEENKT